MSATKPAIAAGVKKSSVSLVCNFCRAGVNTEKVGDFTQTTLCAQCRRRIGHAHPCGQCGTPTFPCQHGNVPPLCKSCHQKHPLKDSILTNCDGCASITVYRTYLAAHRLAKAAQHDKIPQLVETMKVSKLHAAGVGAQLVPLIQMLILEA